MFGAPHRSGPGSATVERLLRLRSVVRGSKGGLQASEAARCSSNRVAGGAETEL